MLGSSCFGFAILQNGLNIKRKLSHQAYIEGTDRQASKSSRPCAS